MKRSKSVSWGGTGSKDTGELPAQEPAISAEGTMGEEMRDAQRMAGPRSDQIAVERAGALLANGGGFHRAGHVTPKSPRGSSRIVEGQAATDRPRRRTSTTSLPSTSASTAATWRRMWRTWNDFVLAGAGLAAATPRAAAPAPKRRTDSFLAVFRANPALGEHASRWACPVTTISPSVVSCTGAGDEFTPRHRMPVVDTARQSPDRVQPMSLKV